MFPSGGQWSETMIHDKTGSLHSLSHGRREPIRESDCEVMLPLTFDEVASLLIRPRGGERRRFISLHDSNTIIRHRASLSEGERAGWECGGAETQHDTDKKTEGCANIWILTITNTKKTWHTVRRQTYKQTLSGGRQKNQGWRFWFVFHLPPAFTVFDV